jgi:hypothetical protein
LAAGGRFTGASVAGLVVGATGVFVFVFVFAVALRHWLRDRSKFREEARACPLSGPAGSSRGLR